MRRRVISDITVDFPVAIPPVTPNPILKPTFLFYPTCLRVTYAEDAKVVG